MKYLMAFVFSAVPAAMTFVFVYPFGSFAIAAFFAAGVLLAGLDLCLNGSDQ